MQILLACAKLMNSASGVTAPLVALPQFEEEANRFALELCQWTAEELVGTLHCSQSIAQDNLLRYQQFMDASQKLPAVLAYYGQAYKHLRASEFSRADLLYAHDHLFICSFLYGLLRPLDLIHPYRLEGTVCLEATGGRQMFAFWRDRLTDVLIHAVKADDGTLVHLATEEMQHLSDWRRVCSEVRVVQPLFYADQGHRLKAVSVHAKSCRGAMARHIILDRLTDASSLQHFEWEGYAYQASYGDALHPHFIRPRG